MAQSTFLSQNVQNTTCSRHFWTFRCRFAWQAQGIVHFLKSEQNVRHVHQRCSEVRAQFPERGCILEHQICRFAKMILHDRCSTSYDLASLFRGRRNALDRWSGKVAKGIGTRPSALLVRGRQLCTQLSIFEGSLAELFRF